MNITVCVFMRTCVDCGNLGKITAQGDLGERLDSRCKSFLACHSQ